MFYAPSIDYYVVTRYADVESVLLGRGSPAAAGRQPRKAAARGPLALGAIVADRSLIPAAVEETLRYDTSVPV